MQDPVGAYHFDRAVASFGLALDAELKKAGANAKSEAQANGRRQSVLSRWLGEPMQFKDPGTKSASSTDGKKDVDSSSSGAVAL